MTNHQILVVEDEVKIRQVLCEYLEGPVMRFPG